MGRTSDPVARSQFIEENRDPKVSHLDNLFKQRAMDRKSAHFVPKMSTIQDPVASVYNQNSNIKGLFRDESPLEKKKKMLEKFFGMMVGDKCL